ncbi:hypothetical protein KSD_18340 [Ktedonobacter sp. SOSP1-85]|uniref:hypothetical protein n=1 Tax=Ktedonobacter sp. SOSP1-85 TaxID=2778367 RepID=UPI001915D120|nr:hypothetical protein [Ktedonobacter sp. SOSP1-85]GHO74063.1 hypothetical protein KSD_18340 [Ktedonobacter sp. SOSP1-85]
MNMPVQDLEQQLRSHYQQEMGEPSPSSALWRQIADRLPTQTPQQQRLAWWQRWLSAFSAPSASPSAPRRAPARLVAACSLMLGALLLVSGLAYTAIAFSSSQTRTRVANRPMASQANTDVLLSQLLTSTKQPVTQQALRYNLFTNLNLAQKAGSDTVKLQKVYADANHLVLGYTITGKIDTTANDTPDDPKHPQNLPTITLSDGQTLKAILVEAKREASKGQIAVLASFNMPSIQGSPKQLGLHISVVTTDSTANFDQTVPFDAGKTVQVNQSVTSDGRTITLNRVVITATETRVYYTVQGASFSPVWELSVASHTYHAYMGSVPPGVEDFGAFNANLRNQTGTWTLKISGRQLDSQHVKGFQETNGSWQFTFTVN